MSIYVLPNGVSAWRTPSLLRPIFVPPQEGPELFPGCSSGQACRSTPKPIPVTGLDFRLCRLSPDPWRVFCIVRDWAAAGERQQLADWGTCESPFIACLESAQVRLKEGSYLQLSSMGGHCPFRGLDAPLALIPA